MMHGTLLNISSKPAKGRKKTGGKTAATGRRMSMLDARCISNAKGRAGGYVNTEMLTGRGLNMPRRFTVTSGALSKSSRFIAGSAFFSA